MKKFTVIIATFLINIIAISILFCVLGFRVNLTDSIPIGLYRITNSNTYKDAFVIFCPDERSSFLLAKGRGYIDYGVFCKGHGYLMKKVAAVSGDVISVSTKGVFVNQKLLPFSKPMLRDGLNRDLPKWLVSNYQLKEKEFITMTNQSEWSFDSRYYGVIYKDQIEGVIIPIWVINKV